MNPRCERLTRSFGGGEMVFRLPLASRSIMFNWKEYARISTTMSRKELLAKVCDYLDPIGEASIEGKSRVEVFTRRYNSFGYEVKIEADCGRRQKIRRRLEISVKYEVQPDAGRHRASVIFWLIGLILLFRQWCQKPVAA